MDGKVVPHRVLARELKAFLCNVPLPCVLRLMHGATTVCVDEARCGTSIVLQLHDFLLRAHGFLLCRVLGRCSVIPFFFSNISLRAHVVFSGYLGCAK